MWPTNVIGTIEPVYKYQYTFFFWGTWHLAVTLYKTGNIFNVKGKGRGKEELLSDLSINKSKLFGPVYEGCLKQYPTSGRGKKSSLPFGRQL